MLPFKQFYKTNFYFPKTNLADKKFNKIKNHIRKTTANMGLWQVGQMEVIEH
jgi:hypothetical protein